MIRGSENVGDMYSRIPGSKGLERDRVESENALALLFDVFLVSIAAPEYVSIDLSVRLWNICIWVCMRERERERR